MEESEDGVQALKKASEIFLKWHTALAFRIKVILANVFKKKFGLTPSAYIVVRKEGKLIQK